jgi:hypothetical protein
MWPGSAAWPARFFRASGQIDLAQIFGQRLQMPLERRFGGGVGVDANLRSREGIKVILALETWPVVGSRYRDEALFVARSGMVGTGAASDLMN